METRKETVIKAINFERPDHLPIWFFNRDELSGDILRFNLAIEENGKSEWGYEWEKLDDGTMGQPAEPVIKELEDLDRWRLPELDIEKRFKGFSEFKNSAINYYLLAGIGISGFTTYTFLRGFSNTMLDLISSIQQANKILDGIFQFENRLITLAGNNGFDGVHFEDDWGTQDGLLISPQMWREIFKPRYEKQFRHAHEHGLTVWFHSCGNIAAIVPDLHDIGVDVINISQPNVVDMVEISRQFKGKQCFMVPVSYQTIAVTGTPANIAEEINRLSSLFVEDKGGLIGYIEDYSCMGMSEENYQAHVNAFRRV